MAIDISDELAVIRSEADGETVIDAIISALNKLNTDGLVDISSELNVIKYDSIGKNVVSLEKGIARALYKLSQYSELQLISVVNQEEYDEVDPPAVNRLYLIYRDDKFITFPLKTDGMYDFTKACWFPIIDDLWDIPTTIRTMLNKPTAGTFQKIVIGKNFPKDSIPEHQFEETRIRYASIYLPSYTIGHMAFAYCEDMIDIYLGSGVRTIAGSAFVGCDKLRTIRIDKERDSVYGAPWGAINATVKWQGE